MANYVIINVADSQSHNKFHAANVKFIHVSRRVSDNI